VVDHRVDGGRVFSKLNLQEELHRVLNSGISRGSVITSSILVERLYTTHFWRQEVSHKLSNPNWY
jgi:hypothetical protein